MDCLEVGVQGVCEPNFRPGLPRVMRVVVIEPLDMESEGCNAQRVTTMCEYRLDDVLHVVSAGYVSVGVED